MRTLGIGVLALGLMMAFASAVFIWSGRTCSIGTGFCHHPLLLFVPVLATLAWGLGLDAEAKRVSRLKPRLLSTATGPAFPLRKGAPDYFSELLMSVNLVFRLVPRPFTTAMIASEMPAAIRPYSIAVAPDSSEKNFKKIRCNFASSEILLRSFTPVDIRAII